MLPTEKNILLFASGSGSNVKAILEYFKHDPIIRVPLIITNNPSAGVIDVARKYNTDVLLLNRQHLDSPILLDTLDLYQPQLLVLAGFLKKIPEHMVNHYHQKIINIHPALLPRHGGQGMYGMHVHQAVINAKDSESGITIHHVNKEYDQGLHLLQKKLTIDPTDTPATLAAKVLQLEHHWYPRVIESLLK